MYQPRSPPTQPVIPHLLLESHSLWMSFGGLVSASAYTKTCLVPNEQGPTLRDAIICLTKEFVPLEGPPVVVRIDGGSGLTSLNIDELLRFHRIFLEIGRIKNKNKNPVAEKAVQELEHELIRLDP